MMVSKGYLVSTAAAGLLALSAAAASAQGMLGNPQWYVKGFGGATFLQDSDVDLFSGGSRVARGDIEFDTGYTAGAAVGADLSPNFALELEYAYRRADVDRFRVEGTDLDGGSGRSDSFMLNALYSFDGLGATGQWRPYVGGGVGTTRIRIDVEDDTYERDWVLGYQLIGGVAYDITPNWSLNGEVRWFAAEGGRYSIGGGESAKADWETVDVLVGASYRF